MFMLFSSHFVNQLSKNILSSSKPLNSDPYKWPPPNQFYGLFPYDPAIPYIQGTSERISRILRSFNISVAHKPTVTLKNTLTNVKDPTDTKTRIETVYKVTCAECLATYIGETGRTLDCRIKEHKRSQEKQDVANRIAVHLMQTNHIIDWEGASCM